jgi:hypothetical protein
MAIASGLIAYTGTYSVDENTKTISRRLPSAADGQPPIISSRASQCAAQPFLRHQGASPPLRMFPLGGLTMTRT